MNRLSRYSLFFLFIVATDIYLSPLLFADQLGSTEQGTSEETLFVGNQGGGGFSDFYFKKYADEVAYLDLNFIGNDVTKNLIIGFSPQENPKLEREDKKERNVIWEQATLDEKLTALSAIDNVFAFSAILGDEFNYEHLKSTAAFFEQVDSDVGKAVAAAKKTFQRPRPMKSNGFSYPSGHSTRAFVREELLSEMFPKCQEALYNQAWQFAQNRVIIGRHYPMDIAAGEIYGKYLATQFRKNPDFQKKWEEAKKEMATAFGQPYHRVSITTPIITPGLSSVILDFLKSRT